MDKLRILIVDDHAMIRQGLRSLLQFSKEINIINECGDGQGAINVCRREAVDVILMDINMPFVSGAEATRVIKREFPQIGIIALSVSENDEDIFEMINAGVSGYLLKDVEADTLVETIREVAAGKTVLHPSITQKVLVGFKEISASKAKKIEEDLTIRESEILVLIAQGNSNKEIAKLLFISEKTVKNHLTHIFRKINVDDRTQAAIYAMKHGLVK